MTCIKLPTWMKDEVGLFLKQQMAMARMLAVRLTDAEPLQEPASKGRVQARDIVAVVKKLDALTAELDALVGGTSALAKQTDDYQMAMAFAHYCERVLKYQERQKARR